MSSSGVPVGKILVAVLARKPFTFVHQFFMSFYVGLSTKGLPTVFPQAWVKFFLVLAEAPFGFELFIAVQAS